MEQQHHNYESFGFINAAFGETENFSIGQEDVSKAGTVSNLMEDFQPPNNLEHASSLYNDPASIYNLPAEPIENYPDKTFSESSTLAAEHPEQKCMELDKTVEADEKASQNENIAQTDPKSPQNDIKDSQNQQLENTEPADTEKATSNENVGEKEEETPNLENSNSVIKDAKTFKKDVGGRKRRRIVMLNDEDSEDESLKNEILDKSSDTEPQNDPQPEKSNEMDNFADQSESGSDEKEMEGIVNRNFLKAKQLLKTAVVIEDPDKKKRKKKRVLESDDEDQVLNTTVDDIGIINENEEVEDEIFTEDIVILNDNIYDIPPDDNDGEKVEDSLSMEVNAESAENEPNAETVPPSEKSEEHENSPQDEGKKETSPKPEENTNEKPEDEVEAILDKIQPMDDDDDFFKFNDSTDEDVKHVPNDEYFGTPDTKNTAIRGRKRGPRSGSRTGPRSAPRIRKRGDRYDKDFVDDSESSSSSESMSSSITSSSSSSDSSRERSRRGRPKQAQAPKKLIPIVQTSSYTITKVPLVKTEQAKKDRWYDQSRNIPNDVYFGDVKVPLHVLHSRWNADENNRPRKPPQGMQNRNVIRPVHIPAGSRSSVPTPVFQHDEETKLNVMKEFMKIAGLKINYPKLFNGVKSTEHKCILLRRILNQKGVIGEPTLAKCRKLRRDLQAKRESAELDKSVILQVEGRTRRTRRGGAASSEDSLGATKTETPTLQPEVLETLTKIKSVIDSDSE